jgi:hypothetical protein
MTDDRARQEAREAAQRQAAMGRRVASLQEGNMGPVLKRWINADVVPIAALMREVAVAYLAGDMAEVGRLLDTPSSELELGRERPLRALMEWCLRGKSPGRADETTYAEDIVLSFMATAVSILASGSVSRPGSHSPKGPTFSSVMASTSDAVKSCVLGQFITGIQGAGAMQAIRERRPELWKQKKSLSRICSLLQSQARPLLREMELAGVESVLSGNKTVLTVMGAKGGERMLTVRPPDAIAWEIMTLCWHGERDGSTSEHRSLWLGFAAMILAAAQRTGGWFEVGGTRTGRKGHTRTTKHLLLSDAARDAIAKDSDRWLSQGFDPEPMVVPPESGDYLTVKHRPVTGQRPPLGLITKAKGTTSWDYGAAALAATPWSVNPYALDVEVSEEDSASIMRIAAHRRLAGESAFYLPTCMDFRGRTYYRTPWVSPQSGDLGKSLLCFPKAETWCEPEGPDPVDSLVMHFAGLYGGPHKVDKAPLSVRKAWWDNWAGQVDEADKPLTLKAHLGLWNAGEWDRIPIQLDGTCNGLQHLSAMFRDEEAARHVNLTRSTLEDAPADIYGVVAGEVAYHLQGEVPVWWARMQAAGIKITRKTTKGPVMVLPYGGTREAVRLSVKTALLDQLGKHGLGTNSEGGTSSSPWHLMTALGYGESKDNEAASYEAFRARDLYDHPGFNTDSGQLAGLIWESIAPVIPKAMAAMACLTAVGGFVGDRGLSWRVGLGPEESRLWVTQAKSKASRKQVTMRGFHLPDMVRRLTLMANSNEVDPKGHRTGIVANFIHSLDGAHLAATVALFRERGGGCVGSVHDCLLVRPSEAALMGRCLRDTFVELYEEDPLAQPVRLISEGVDGPEVEEYASWYALAEAADQAVGAQWEAKGSKGVRPRVQFPVRGSFDITEVRDSAWFFS